MRQAATLIGGKLATDQEGFKIPFDGNFPDIHIYEETESKWKRDVSNAVNRAMTMQLRHRTEAGQKEEEEESAEPFDPLGLRPDNGERQGQGYADMCAPGVHQDPKRPCRNPLPATPEDETDNNPRKKETKQAKKKGRQDLRGVGNAIDTYATTILLRNKANHLLKRNKLYAKKAAVTSTPNS